MKYDYLLITYSLYYFIDIQIYLLIVWHTFGILDLNMNWNKYCYLLAGGKLIHSLVTLDHSYQNHLQSNIKLRCEKIEKIVCKKLNTIIK